MGFVQRRLVKLVVRVVAFPKTTVAICLLLLAASVIYAWTSLSLSTDENALLTPDLPFFKDYLRFDAKFPENESFVVVVEPRDYTHLPLAKRWIGLADAIKAKLTDPNEPVHEDIDRVDTHAPLDELAEQGVMFDDWDGVKEGSADIQRFIPLLKILGQKPGLESVVLGDNVTARYYNSMAKGPPAESLDFATLVTRTLNSALQTPPEKWTHGADTPNLTELDPASKTDPSRFGYYLIPDESKRNDPQHKDEKILIINIYENRDYSTLADVTEPLNRMRAAVADAAKAYPEFTATITGRPALEADEMATSDHDTKFAEILGLSLVFVALWIFLRNIWLVVVAELGLGVGIGWTFGWATLSTGRLNLLSLVFVIALIGIGMDYLIQILTRYRHEKKRYARPKAIWARVFRYASPPISTACAGAAGAFLVAKFTNFAGAGELGIIAGGGLLLCLAAGYTLIPALLTIFPAHCGIVTAEKRYTDPASANRMSFGKLIIPALWVIVSVGGLWLALPPKFDPDLIKLQAQGLPSVKLVHKLPTWYAAVMSDDLNELLAARTKIFAGVDDKSTILRTDSVLDAQEKQAWMNQNNAELSTIKWLEPAAPSASDLAAIAQAARGMVANWSKDKSAGDLTELRSQVQSLADTLSNKNLDSQNLERLAEWQRAFVDELHLRATSFIPPKLNLDKLPKEVRDHYVSYLPGIAEPRSERSIAASQAVVTKKPTYVLYVYPKEDLWSGDKLGRFVDELELRMAGSPPTVTLTGIAVQLYHSTQEIHHAFLMSSFYALLLIFVLVLLDLRNLSQTLLAVLVLAAGLPMLLLMMWLWRAMGEPFGIPGSWNFANFFGLPILIGAGHEYGVFMVHRYRETLHDPRRVWGRWDVSDRALLLCAIVTSFSFGFLTLAQHRGLASLGWVMAVGSACTYMATLLVLRPILLYLLKRNSAKIL